MDTSLIQPIAPVLPFNYVKNVGQSIKSAEKAIKKITDEGGKITKSVGEELTKNLVTDTKGTFKAIGKTLGKFSPTYIGEHEVGYDRGVKSVLRDLENWSKSPEDPTPKDAAKGIGISIIWDEIFGSKNSEDRTAEIGGDVTATGILAIVSAVVFPEADLGVVGVIAVGKFLEAVNENYFRQVPVIKYLENNIGSIADDLWQIGKGAIRAAGTSLAILVEGAVSQDGAVLFTTALDPLRNIKQINDNLESKMQESYDSNLNSTKDMWSWILDSSEVEDAISGEGLEPGNHITLSTVSDVSSKISKEIEEIEKFADVVTISVLGFGDADRAWAAAFGGGK